MNSVRLVCGGQAVDLPTDFGILINKSIADIREPENRESDWTKTFTLPGTKANNKLFTHLFQLDLSIRNTSSSNFNPDFNPNLKAGAVLYVDEVTQIEGFIRLLSINVTDHGQIEYECTMHGQLADLFTTMADGKLADLNFSEYNHTINSTNIFNSWDTSVVKNGSPFTNFSGGAPIGDGYVYTWLDNGEYPNYGWMFTDYMTPCLYAKTIVDKIFSGTGYSYSSGSFFNTDLFKRLVIPCQTHTPILSEANVAERLFEATRSTDQVFAINDLLKFNNEVSDPSNQYNPTTGVYTNLFGTGSYDLIFVNKATITNLPSGQNTIVLYDLLVNGVFKKSIYGGGSAVGTTLTLNQTISVAGLRLNDNDTVTIKLRYIGNLTTASTGATYTQNSGSRLFNGIVESTFGYNDEMDFTGFFSDETKQSDFMKWVFIMFNLYIEPEADNPKKLVIKPREEFYNNTVRDWTMKRDLLQPLEIIPMGELDAGRYLFTYAEGDDEGNKEYAAYYARTYGDRQLSVVNDFIKDEKKIEIGFAPSTLNTFPNDDKVLTYIDNGNSAEKRFHTGKMRILQYAPLTCQSYTIYYGKHGSTTSTTKTKYPFTAHIDNPTAPTTDINFGMPRFIGLKPGTPMTNNNLYNQYWSKYIQEVTDKDSKIVKGAFHLTPADMEKLSFQDLYFFDGNYFRLNKVEDYDPVNPSVNICEFLFLKTGQTFTATTGSTGGGGTQGGGNEQEYDPRGGGTSGKVIQQRGISIGDFNQVGDGIGVGTAINNFGLRNTALATSGVTFIGDDAIVIGEAPANPVITNEVWLQGVQITTNNLTGNRITTVTTGNHTATLDEDIIIMKDTAACTVSLPAASTATNKVYHIKKFGNSVNAVTIDPNGSEKIDNATTKTMGGYLDSIMIVCDGVEWYTI